MVSLEKRKIADLNCHVITAAEPECLVVLCHGFGAPGDDLVQIGAYLLESQPEFKDRVAIAFPEAPLSLNDMGMHGGRAWWPLDIEQLNRVIDSGDFRDLREESPERLPQARIQLLHLIEQLQSELGLEMSQTIIGGFSQGAMLATDVTLHAVVKPAGLIVWSGTLLNEAIWRPLAVDLRELPVVQSHGKSDQILPFEAARWLEELLRDGNARVNFIEFPGPHTIPPESLDAAGELILSVLQH